MNILNTLLKSYRVLSRERVYDGFFKMDRMSFHVAGLTAPVTREFQSRGPSATMLMFDPKLDKILIVEEFRAPSAAIFERQSEAWLPGLVAGMVDVEDTAIETVQREAVEEAGIDVTGAELFGPFDTMPSPGASTEIVHHYIALVDLKKVVNGAVFGLEAEGERTITFARDRKAVMADLERGALLHGPLATSLLWLELLILKGHIKL